MLFFGGAPGLHTRASFSTMLVMKFLYCGRQGRSESQWSQVIATRHILQTVVQTHIIQTVMQAWSALIRSGPLIKPRKNGHCRGVATTFLPQMPTL